MRKPKPAVSAWIIRERKRLGLKPVDLARQLTAMGLPVAEGTPRTWEAGRSPSADNIAGLERIFGSVGPDAASPDSESLIAAMTAALLAQTRALTDLRADLSELRATVTDARQAATLEREAMTDMIGNLGDQLDELLSQAGIAAEAADQGPGHR